MGSPEKPKKAPKARAGGGRARAGGAGGGKVRGIDGKVRGIDGKVPRIGTGWAATREIRGLDP